MSIGSGSGAKEGLDFERAQAQGGAAPAGVSCGTCQRQITSQYFTLGQAVLCDACRHRYEMELGERSELRCLARAGLLGLLAALAGAALWGGVIWISGYELGVIAVVVGLMVGAAVKAGSGGRGGRLYQGMAVLLTYLAVSLAYVPLVIQGFREVAQEQETASAAPEAEEAALPPLGTEVAEAPAPPAAAAAEPAGEPSAEPAADFEATAGQIAFASLAVLGVAAALPFLAGFENAIGLLIIGFALWEAWRLNARVDLSVKGPYQVGAPAGA
jgi:hypothetical protein